MQLLNVFSLAVKLEVGKVPKISVTWPSEVLFSLNQNVKDKGKEEDLKYFKNYL